MPRLTLLPALLLSCAVGGQPVSGRLHLAEKLKATNPAQSIQIAQAVFPDALRHHDYYNACIAGLLLGDFWRKAGNYTTAIRYDSLAVLMARQWAVDTPLQQRAVVSYIRNFLEELQITVAENLLERYQSLFLQYPSYATCQWYEMKALCSFNNVQIGAAIAYSQQAKEIAGQIRDTLATMHAQLMVFKFQSFFLKTDNIRSAFEALTYFDSIRHHMYAAQAANIIGLAFETTHNTGKALEYYQKAYASNIADRNEAAAMQTHMNMADALAGGNQPETAKHFLWEALRYFGAKHRIKNTAFATLRLAKIYLSTESYDSALLFFKITDSLNRRLGNKIMSAGSAMYQGLLQGKMGNFKQRDSLANRAMKELFRLNVAELMPVAQQRLQDGMMGRLPDSVRGRSAFVQHSLPGIWQDTGTSIPYFDGAARFNWQTGTTAEYDSTFTEKQSRIQANAENEYRVNNYRDTIRQVKTETADARQQSQAWKKGLSIAALFVLLLAAGLWLQYRNRRQAEQDKAKIAELQAEIHHRVTNNLGVINAMVEMAAKAQASSLSMAALKTRIDSVALVHRLLYSGTAAAGKISLQPYFEALSAAIAAIFEKEQAIKIIIDAPVETESLLAEKLGLIVNELITNSFKYAFAATDNAIIRLYARQQKDELYLTVADNGSGLPENLKKGQGSKLIKGISHQLKGKYRHENKGGAFFELTVPV